MMLRKKDLSSYELQTVSIESINQSNQSINRMEVFNVE